MIQRRIPFDAIPTWGYNEESFVLYVGTFVRQEKLVFNSSNGKEIINLIQQYVTYLSEKFEAKRSD